MDPFITITVPADALELIIESVTTHSAAINRDSRLPFLEAEWSASLRFKAEFLEGLAVVLTDVLNEARS